MFDRLFTNDTIINQILKIMGIGEIEAFINADGQNLIGGFHVMTVDIAEMLSARHQPDLGHMGAGGFVKKEQDRQGHPCGNANLNPKAKGQENRRGHGGKINARIDPGAGQDREINKA